MLLVDDGERQVPEPDVLLDQRVSPHQQVDRTVGDRGQQGASGSRWRAPEQHPDRDAKRPQQRVDDIGVLPRQDLGRRQQHRLEPGASHVMDGHRRHHRLPGADVALQQTVHRLRPGNILENLPRRAALGMGELEWKRRDEGSRRRLVERDGVGGVRLAGPFRLLHCDLVEEDLLKFEPVAGSLEGFHRFRKVDLLDGGRPGHEAAARQDLTREHLVELLGQPEQRPDLGTKPARRQPLGLRVDGHDAGRVARVAGDLLIFGVLHHQAAVEVDLAREENLISLMEVAGDVGLVEPDHIQLTGIVGNRRPGDLHVLARRDLPRDVVDARADCRLHPGPDPGDRRHVPKVSVFSGEIEQEIANRLHAHPFELAAVGRVDPGDGRHRVVEREPWHGQAIR